MPRNGQQFVSASEGTMAIMDFGGMVFLHHIPNITIPKLRVLKGKRSKLTTKSLLPGDVVIVAYQEGKQLVPGLRIDVLGASAKYPGRLDIILQFNYPTNPSRRLELMNCDLAVGKSWYASNTVCPGKIAAIYHFKVGCQKQPPKTRPHNKKKS